MNATLPRMMIADQFPLFDVLTPAEKQRLEDMAEYKVKPRYSYIYLSDEPSDTLYFLLRGGVKIGMHSNDGKEVIKSLIHPKAIFGEMGLIGETRRQEFAQTLKEEVHLYAIRVSDFRQLMKSNFALSDRVMNSFGDRLIRAERKLESLIFKDARTRIVEFIRDSVERRGHKVGFEMLLKHSLTHQDIANITCTSRQTVTLVLNELRKSDLIYFNRGKILVRDIGKLC
jgi:CRP/FNR family transcriptional regulator, cyclic AMP receptor protein